MIKKKQRRNFHFDDQVCFINFSYFANLTYSATLLTIYIFQMSSMYIFQCGFGSTFGTLLCGYTKKYFKYVQIIKIKSLFYSRYYAEACNEWQAHFNG